MADQRPLTRSQTAIQEGTTMDDLTAKLEKMISTQHQLAMKEQRRLYDEQRRHNDEQKRLFDEQRKLNAESMAHRRQVMRTQTMMNQEIDFPRFEGVGMKEWMFNVEQFFLIDQTPHHMKARLAAAHFSGEASTFHESILLRGYGYYLDDWIVYKRLLIEHFEVVEDIVDDPIAELNELEETDGIEDCYQRFELICTRVSLLSEEYLVRVFLAGLRYDTQSHVRMFQPQTVRSCFLQGKLYEWVHRNKIWVTPLPVGCAKEENGEDDSLVVTPEKELLSKSVFVLQLQDTNVTAEQDGFLSQSRIEEEMVREVIVVESTGMLSELPLSFDKTETIRDSVSLHELELQESIESYTAISCVPQSQVPIAVLESRRICQENSSVTVDDVLYGFGKIDGMSMEEVKWKTSEKYTLMSFALYSYDFESQTSTFVLHIFQQNKLISCCDQANRVWKPGGLSCSQAHWDWLWTVYTIGRVVEIIKLHGIEEWICKLEIYQEFQLIWWVGFSDVLRTTSTRHDISYRTTTKHAKGETNERFGSAAGAYVLMEIHFAIVTRDKTKLINVAEKMQGRTYLYLDHIMKNSLSHPWTQMELEKVIVYMLPVITIPSTIPRIKSLMVTRQNVNGLNVGGVIHWFNRTSCHTDFGWRKFYKDWSFKYKRCKVTQMVLVDETTFFFASYATFSNLWTLRSRSFKEGRFIIGNKKGRY